MKKISAKIKQVPLRVWILLAIMALGIFLRTYRYHDFLRFNADQARDASVVSDFLDGKSSLPLLGPKAGGTEFKLGGAFYSLQIISAAIFGNYPDKMAYPDLVAGILTIPLLYLFAKRYFDTKIALILSFAGSISVYLIKYSRFAWNPNSGPFYTLLFLYALLLIADKKVAHKTWWIAAAGVGMGIGVQLHTLMLVIMPTVALLFFAYLAKNDKQMWKKAALVFAIALVLNVTQVIDLAKNNGSNIKAFLGGANSKTARSSSSVIGDVAQVASCQTQADAFILTGLGDDDTCGTSLIMNGYSKNHGIAKVWWALGLLASITFTVVGIWLWAAAIRREEDENKKLMLLLTGTYAILGFLLLIPLARDLVSIRYYLAIIFVPFMLLGFWLEKILLYKKLNYKYVLPVIVSLIVVILLYGNVSAISQYIVSMTGKKHIKGNTSTEITLGETEFIARYIENHAEGARVVFLQGKQKFLFKYVRSLEYFTRQQKITVEALSRKKNITDQDVIISLGVAKEGKEKGVLPSKIALLYNGKDFATHRRFTIVQLLKKQ